MPEFVSDRRLYLTGPADDPATEVVEEGDERARTLLVGEGGTVEAATAERFKLGAKAEDKAAPEAKAQAPAEDKAVEPPESKSGKAKA